MMLPEQSDSESYFTPAATKDQKESVQRDWRHWATEGIKLVGQQNGKMTADQIAFVAAEFADLMMAQWDARFNDPPILTVTGDDEEEEEERSGPQNRRRGGGRRS